MREGTSSRPLVSRVVLVVFCFLGDLRNGDAFVGMADVFTGLCVGRRMMVARSGSSLSDMVGIDT